MYRIFIFMLALAQDPGFQLRAASARDFVGLAVAAAIAPMSPLPAADLAFFQVVNAYPEARFNALPGHVDRSTSCVSLACFDSRVLDNGKVELTPTSKTLTLDAKRLCSTSIFQQLRAWKPSAAKPKLE